MNRRGLCAPEVKTILGAAHGTFLVVIHMPRPYASPYKVATAGDTISRCVSNETHMLRTKSRHIPPNQPKVYTVHWLVLKIFKMTAHRYKKFRCSSSRAERN